VLFQLTFLYKVYDGNELMLNVLLDILSNTTHCIIQCTKLKINIYRTFSNLIHTLFTVSED